MPPSKTSVAGLWLQDFPALYAEWHPDRNVGIDPSKVRAGRQGSVWWRCAAGHEFSNSVYSRATNGSPCATCWPPRAENRPRYLPTRRSGAPVTDGAGATVVPRAPKPGTSLADLYPALVAQWVRCVPYPDAAPQDVIPGSPAKVEWRCPAGTHPNWVTTIRSLVRSAEVGRNGCRPCYWESRKGAPSPGVHRKKTLAARAPHLSSEWHPDKNGEVTPATHWAHDPKSVWWLCSTCGHEWEVSSSARIKADLGCRPCAMRGVGVKNRARYAAKGTLADLFPAVAKEWARDLNPEHLTPETVSPGCADVVLWKCLVCPEVWPTSPHARTRKMREGRDTEPSGCPACLNQVARPWNCLATLRPDLAAEWHPSLNGERTAADVVPGSSQNVYWLCPEGHEWPARVFKRSDRGDGCGDCLLRSRSKPEVRLEHELSVVLPVSFGGRRIKGVAADGQPWSYEADIIVPDLRLVVEYDGSYWHRSEDRQVLDRRKNERLTAAGWTVIRLRETPLAPIGEHDVVVPRNAKPFVHASAALGRVAELFPALGPTCAAYVAHGAAQRSREAEAALRAAPTYVGGRRRTTGEQQAA